MRKVSLSFLVVISLFFSHVFASNFTIEAVGEKHYTRQNGSHDNLEFDIQIRNQLEQKLYLNSATFSVKGLELEQEESTCDIGKDSTVPLQPKGRDGDTCLLQYTAVTPSLSDKSQASDYQDTLTITDGLERPVSLGDIGVKVTPIPGKFVISRSSDDASLPELNLKLNEVGSIRVHNTGDMPISDLAVEVPEALKNAGVFTSGSCITATSLSAGSSCQLNYTATQAVATQSVTITGQSEGNTMNTRLPVTVSTLGHFQFERDNKAVTNKQQYIDDTTGTVVVRNTGGTAITDVKVTLPEDVQDYFTTTDCTTLKSESTCSISYAIPATPTLGSATITVTGVSADNSNLALPGEVLNKWAAAGLDGGDITALISAPAQGANTLYAGTEGGGVFKSTDGGQSWNAVNNGLSDLNVVALAADGSTIYAGTLDGVFKSTDEGNWEMVGGPILDRIPVNALTDEVSTIYAGTAFMGVFKSTDEGENWTKVGGNTLDNQWIFALTTVGGTIYAGTDAGVFKSADGGNWQAVNTGLSNIIIDALVADGSTIYAGTFDGVFKSTDGTEWTKVGGDVLDAKWVRALSTDGTTIYAGTENGVFKSTDGGGWEAMNIGLSNLDIKTLLINGKMMYAGTNGSGVFTVSL